MKILKYDKVTFNLTDDEAKEITEFLTSPERTTHYNFKGQSLKSMKMEILDEKVQNINPIYLDYSWSDDQLTEFEKEIFGPNWEKGKLIRKTFKEYMVDLGAWIINSKYPNGAVGDHKLYIELNAKWDKLQDLRYRREKAKGFPTYEAIAKKIRKGLYDLSNRIDVRDDKLKERINDEQDIERGIQLDKIPF